MTGKGLVQFNTDSSHKLKGAPSEIRAMLHSLITNAVESSADDSPVIVEVISDGSKTVIAVIDSGKGLSKDIKDKLFSPHVSDKPEGAGMGLYITRRISRSYYNGDVALENNQSGGCTATLILEDAGSL